MWFRLSFVIRFFERVIADSSLEFFRILAYTVCKSSKKFGRGIQVRKQTLFLLVFQIVALAFSSTGAAQAPSSVPPPEGWSQCPRCQNNKDRADSKVKYKVEGHPFNPHDLSGVWGFG